MLPQRANQRIGCVCGRWRLRCYDGCRGRRYQCTLGNKQIPNKPSQRLLIVKAQFSALLSAIDTVPWEAPSTALLQIADLWQNATGGTTGAVRMHQFVFRIKTRTLCSDLRHFAHGNVTAIARRVDRVEDVVFSTTERDFYRYKVLSCDDRRSYFGKGFRKCVPCRFVLFVIECGMCLRSATR